MITSALKASIQFLEREQRFAVLWLLEASGFFLLTGYFTYGFYYRHFLSMEAKYTILGLALLYIFVVMPLRYYVFKADIRFKVILFFKTILKYLYNLLHIKLPQNRLKVFQSKQEKFAFLFIIIQVIFIPAMVKFFVEYFLILLGYFSNTSGIDLGGTFSWFFFLSTVMVVIDTLYFSFGYMAESKTLKNRVKSVDTTILGWASALACYVPFNSLTNELFPMFVKERIFFLNEKVTFVIYLVVVILYFTYLSATISLGPKCSNLCNRGIVTWGAYRVVRHPAYISKVLAWWVLSIPILNLKVMFSLVGWTIIYYLRSVTEERHLLKDSEYQEYTKKTKWMFIPGLV